MDDVSRHVDYSFPGHDIELSRPFSPELVFWQLTPLGTKRIDDQTLPGSLPHNAYRILDYLTKLEYAEEDEMSNGLDLALTDVRSILKRLLGYGYVQQVQLKQETG